MAEDGCIASQSFLVERRSVGAARRFIVAALDDWGLFGLAHVALLLTSELATNALLHARTEFQVTARYWEGKRLRVEVLDGNSRRPTPAVIRPDATSGRGLNVVRALASSWGVEDHIDGKVVWFELAVPRSRAAD